MSYFCSMYSKIKVTGSRWYLDFKNQGKPLNLYKIKNIKLLILAFYNFSGNIMLIFISNLIWLVWLLMLLHVTLPDTVKGYFFLSRSYADQSFKGQCFRGVKRKTLETNIESTEPLDSSVVCIEHCFCAAVSKRIPTLRERINYADSRLRYHLYSEPRRRKKTDD